jgi:hypothetical protein
MTAVRRPHGTRVEQLAQQRQRIVGADRKFARRLRTLKLAEQSAAMRPAGPRHAVAGNRLRGLGEAFGESVETNRPASIPCTPANRA